MLGCVGTPPCGWLIIQRLTSRYRQRPAAPRLLLSFLGAIHLSVLCGSRLTFNVRQNMKNILIAIWSILAVSGSLLYYWFMHGSWSTHGSSLIEHDAVRFGFVPIFISAGWGFLLLIALLLPFKGLPQKKTTPGR